MPGTGTQPPVLSVVALWSSRVKEDSVSPAAELKLITGAQGTMQGAKLGGRSDCFQDPEDHRSCRNGESSGIIPAIRRERRAF